MTKEKQEQLEILLSELRKELCTKHGTLYIELTERETRLHLCDVEGKSIQANSIVGLLALDAEFSPEKAKQARIAKLQAELAALTSKPQVVV